MLANPGRLSKLVITCMNEVADAVRHKSHTNHTLSASRACIPPRLKVRSFVFPCHVLFTSLYAIFFIFTTPTQDTIALHIPTPYMTLRTCTKDGCKRPAERYAGSCMLCAQHLCTQHLHLDSHTCPTRETDPDAYFAAYDVAKKKYLHALLFKVDVTALQAVASAARDGVACTIPALSSDLDDETRLARVSAQCGGQNAHVDICFEDGVTWLARLRLDDPLLPPTAVQKRVLESEVATLKFFMASHPDDMTLERPMS